MADRTCPTCKTLFTFPSLLKKHMEKTVHCMKTNSEINQFMIASKANIGNINNVQTVQIIKNKCNKCNKIFSRIDNYTKHVSKCNTNNVVHENLNIQTQININNTTNNINNTINNVVINIQHIYPFGFEKLPNISKEKMKALLLSGDKGVIEIIKLVYEQDENKNFYKMNIKTNNISYLNDKYKLDICQENEMKATLYKNCISLPNDMLVICKDILTTNEILFINSNNKFFYDKIKEEIYDNGLKNIINTQIMYNSKDTKLNINKYLQILNTNPIIKQDALNNLNETKTISNKTRRELKPKLSLTEINNKLGDPLMSPELEHDITHNDFCMKKFEDTKYKQYWDKRKHDEYNLVMSLEDKNIGDIIELDKRIAKIDHKLNKMSLIHNDITFDKELDNVSIASDYVRNNRRVNDVANMEDLQGFQELESR